MEPALADRLDVLVDGHCTLGNLMGSLDTNAEKLLVISAAYVLWRSGALKLSRV